MSANLPLNLSGFVTDKTSYGLVLLNILHHLQKQYLVSLFPCGQIGEINDKILFKDTKDAIQLSHDFDPSAISLRVNHQFSMAESVGYGERVGYTFFEVDNFTKLEKTHLNSLDRLIVSSEWAKNICDSLLKVPTYVAPLGVNRDIFKTVDFKPNKCVFLTIGKWEVRKDQDGIVAAFNRAFEVTDNVELWMVFDHFYVSRPLLESKQREYLNTKLGSRIKIIPRLVNQEAVARLMQQAYCFVSNSKAEAWNMEVLEAMSCGKLCITPSCTGESEYVNMSNAFITETNGMETANDGQWFGQNDLNNAGQWHKPSFESLLNNMKAVYKVFNDISVNIDGIKTAEEYSWLNTANHIQKVLNVST